MSEPSAKLKIPDLKPLCNLGCGKRFHADWINVDFSVTGPGVIAHNLIRGLPFESGTFEMVYHSHVLEHFHRHAGLGFLRECHRVLRSNGIIRVAIPDLEGIARHYLAALDDARSGSPNGKWNHHWMSLELFDQMVRETSGGDMGRWIARPDLPNREFVLSRVGKEAEGWLHQPSQAGLAQRVPNKSETPLVAKLARWPIRRFFSLAAKVRRSLLKIHLGNEMAALEIGRFRLGGEVHLCMYDEVMLRDALQQAGFTQCVRRPAVESYHEKWPSFQLDADGAGIPHKPDSLFMEARKS